ncbi:MAG: hypothetical protein J7599_06215 [Niabella sp.]|nr:hypothetical protein [Niabella sp.]
MRSFAILLICFSSLIGCSKSGKDRPVYCDEQMIKKFEDQLSCSGYPGMYTVLMRGEYQGKAVYFVETACIACNTAPPSKGIRCDNTEVTFGSPDHLEYVIMVKGCSN